MQKIINVIALLSGLVSLTIVVGGATVFVERENIINNVKTQLINGVSDSVKELLPTLIDSSLPELPKNTGDVLPSTPNFKGL